MADTNRVITETLNSIYFSTCLHIHCEPGYKTTGKLIWKTKIENSLRDHSQAGVITIRYFPLQLGFYVPSFF